MSSAGSSSNAEQSSSRRQLALFLALVLLGSSLFVRTPAFLPGRTAMGVMGIFAVIAVVLLWRRSAAASEAGSTDRSDGDRERQSDAERAADGDSSVWNAIPSWQYEGRHVESGGLARSEQERALEDVRQQAAELSEEPPEK
ncbi:hypothetical protein EA462_12255 [Natrarchaeobius halalkaliphilus]|uniref:Uncharacterized protein n=1 Tax=Natrarchaeobius halalkaliphilus TaxID=1679091 RepID=A0A3N6LMS3_9EURY|nr:hypothetical protein [Natrarchaeobius halalkaliphilus]RQG89137.1 hypothetical protein EA462_12255 [Natrarchaeobius halalkaliphilus]